MFIHRKIYKQHEMTCKFTEETLALEKKAVI